MSKCPKCGYKLKLTDIKPNCPKCGINLVYYGMDERLTAEADAAEVEHAALQKKIDRLKASFAGSKLAVLRIFLSLLPIGALMLPLCTVNYSGPFIEQTASNVNAISLYNLVSSMDFDALFTMLGSALVGKGFIAYFISLVSILLSAVFVVIALIALCAACGPKGGSRNIANNLVSIILAVVSGFSFKIFASEISAVFPEFFSAKLQYGLLVYIIALVLLLAVNIVLAKNKINVKYKECFVGGIPADEFNELLANGTPIEELHARMDVILAEREAKRREELAKKAAELKAKEDEELAKKAHKA